MTARHRTIRLRALAAASLGICLTHEAHAQSGVVVVTPEPVGYARQLVSTRGGSGGGLDLTDPRAAGLELAKPGKLPEATRPPVTTRATSTLQLLSTSTRLEASPVLESASVYRPLASELIVAQPYPTNTGIVPPVITNPTAPPDPELERLERLKELQRREQRERLERESQQRVFQLLQGKVEEITALKKKRKEEAEKRLEQRNDIRGPSALSVINLLDGLYIDRGVNLDQSDILAIDHHLYQDANPETGLYYYAPKRYDLQWDPQNQYAMTVIYGMAGQKDGEGEVFMATRLQAGVDLAELQLAEELLRA